MTSTTTRRKPHESPPPALHDEVTLRNGPLAGRCLRLLRADPAMIHLRTDDGTTTCIYSGRSADGVLTYRRSYAAPKRRRRRPARETRR